MSNYKPKFKKNCLVLFSIVFLIGVFCFAFNINKAQAAFPGWDSIDTIAILPTTDVFLDKAAQELQTYLGQMSGRSWTIVQGDPGGVAIRLDVNPDLPEFAGRNNEAVQIISDTDGIRITGKIPLATRHGAYLLLEKLGVRWFFKHPIWEVVPESLEDPGTFNEIHEPDFIYRSPANENQLGADDIKLWQQRNRLIGYAAYPAGQNYRGIAPPETYYSSHPEWYTGTETPPAGYTGWQLDSAQESLTTHSITYAQTKLNKTTTSNYWGDEINTGAVSFEPNDGSGWNPPYSTTQEITDNAFALANNVAAGIAESNPGQYVSILSYSTHAGIPSFSLNPNVYVVICDGTKLAAISDFDKFTSYADKGAALGWYQFLAEWNYHQEKPPGRLQTDYLTQLSRVKDLGAITYSYENSDSWGGYGLTFWLVSQMTWDSSLDIDTLKQDFYDKAFGVAAGDMKNYFEAIDETAYGLQRAFNYLDSALDTASGNEDILARIRYLVPYTYYVWKAHYLTYANLTNQELADLYTMVFKTRDLYVLYYNYLTNPAYTDITFNLYNALINRGYTAQQIIALQDFALPTTQETSDWFDEAIDYFDGLNPGDTLEQIQPREISLMALGDNVTEKLEPIRHSWRDSILIPSNGNENVTVNMKGRGYLFWFAPDGFWLDLKYVDSDDAYTSVNFTATEPGTYMLVTGVTRWNPSGTWGYYDVPGRPAALLAAPDSRVSAKVEAGIRFAPTFQVNTMVTTYFYVPEGTTYFKMQASFGSVTYPYGTLTEPDGETEHAFDFDGQAIGELLITEPQAGLWKISIFKASGGQPGQFWFIGIPPLVWHNPEYLLVETGEALPPPPPPSTFTLSATDRLHLFRDESNTLRIVGSNFDLSTDFRIKFLQSSSEIASFTFQPNNNTTLEANLTSDQVNTLPIGPYDLKIERTTDSVSQTYTKQILITTLGDIWSSTATEVAEQKRDGKVNLYDASRMMSKWGSAQETDLAEVDINAGPDNISLNKIDLFDANLIMRNWRPQ